MNKKNKPTTTKMKNFKKKQKTTTQKTMKSQIKMIPTIMKKKKRIYQKIKSI